MKNLYIICCLLLLPYLAISQDIKTFDHDGIERKYYIHIPEDLPPQAPLVMVLHGYGNTARLIKSYSTLDVHADEHKFVACYPQGTDDLGGTSHWNANLNISETDDIGFLVALAQHLQEEYDLNPAHTFSCGTSNGGYMSYALACARPDVFKGIASVIGTMSGYDWENCNPSEVVPVLQISGIADETVPFAGTPADEFGWGGAPGAIEISKFWQEKNETTTFEKVELHPNLTAEYYRGGINENEVWFYPIEGFGHTWPGVWNKGETGIDAAVEIWKFFELIVNKNATSIDEELPIVPIRIYKEPGSNVLQLINIQQEQQYEIFDSFGRIIQRGQCTPSQMIRLNNLTSDLYFIRLESGKAFKFIHVQ